MAKIEEKTNDYRLERKKRLAKAAKTRKKGSVDSAEIISRVIYVLLGVGAVAVVCALLYSFGVPQRMMPALKVGDRTYSVSEYNYYYINAFQVAANSTNSLGITLFDSSKDPAAQMTTDEDGNQISYADYFKNQVKENLETSNYYLKLAKSEGMELSEEHKSEIDEHMSELKSYAEQYGYSTSRYISLLYGPGLTEKKFRSMLEEQYLVAQYSEEKNEAIYDGISDEDIEAKYAEDPSAYQLVDIRLLGKALPTTEADETEDATATDATATDAEKTATEAKAEEMLGKITDEASFIELAKEYCDEGDRETFESETASLVKGLKKSIVSSNIGADLAEWLYDDARVTGDKRTYSTSDYAYVIYLIKPAYRNDEATVSARHVLVSFDSVKSELEAQTTEDASATDAAALDDTTVKTVTAEDGTKVSNEGTSYSTEVVLAAYEQAKKILDEYENGEKTEDSFASLAELYSADTGSVGEEATNGGGGLYENIERGTMVEPFENWIYDASRQPGDTGIVMTNYGWHVMYFVSKADEPTWKADIRKTLGDDIVASATDAEMANSDITSTEKAFYKLAWKSALKNINKLYVSSSES